MLQIKGEDAMLPFRLHCGAFSHGCATKTNATRRQTCILSTCFTHMLNVYCQQWREVKRLVCP